MAENKNRSDQSSEPNSSEQDINKRKGDQQKNKGRKGSSSTAKRENTTQKSSGSSQRNDDLNVGPMDAELDELSSKSRTAENNQTGPGLG
ncbi:MAG: hypothetical protein H7122_03470 [Chitinophagaceae bacterium]|nr:hypothetical protein [Chitinophagaceae bacterium]